MEVLAGSPTRGPGGFTLVRVDTRSEIREFLTSRRGRLTPDQVGLTAYGPRRVPGLRREEVAVLAGVSVPYYTRLERGNLSGVSESVLEALARALQLDEAERAHLFDLARAAGATARTRRRPTKQRVRPSVQHTLDAITGAPAVVLNGRLDILAANLLGRALYSEMYVDPVRPVNNARFVFLNPRAHDFYGDWERAANDTVAILRSEVGRDPYDRGLSDLVGELSTQSETFRTRWAAHNVRIHQTGAKHFHHPVVGDLSLTFEMLELRADTGLTVLTHTAEPGSKSEEALNLLGSWAATLDQAETAHATDGG
jgi:transcriptional regulator with XRE-family HTH domain